VIPLKVYINDNETGGRQIVDAELIKERATTILVKLPDGNVITRQKKRDIPTEEEITA
jgi:hypothetical protein